MSIQIEAALAVRTTTQVHSFELCVRSYHPLVWKRARVLLRGRDIVVVEDTRADLSRSVVPQNSGGLNPSWCVVVRDGVLNLNLSLKSSMKQVKLPATLTPNELVIPGGLDHLAPAFEPEPPSLLLTEAPLNSLVRQINDRWSQDPSLELAVEDGVLRAFRTVQVVATTRQEVV